ncbi:hypothetical protein sr11705 [Sporisorium reilianum SRZ2]|uniref:Uncharacterized protein n=1 Tax=Sporisorium reilianum (strain SRZ2) TaxID=999809 RepID=E6ZKA2_SPORE|nr:hypothetical protein sr11705 [Sporisorium reilianum SRZ2]
MNRPATLAESEAQRQRREELIYKLARSEVETHQIERVQVDVLPSPPQVFVGWAATQSLEFDSAIYRRNVTLKDGDDVVLQRFAPFSAADEGQMEEEAREGRKLLGGLYSKACAKPGNKALEEHKSSKVRYDFGGLYVGENPYLSFQTAQDYIDLDKRVNRDGKAVVAEFCAWFYSYVEQYVDPLLYNAEFGLSNKFREKLIHRSRSHFPWVVEHIPRLSGLCRPSYSTFTPSKGFDSSAEDEEDSDGKLSSPAILVNFGQHALLELAEYNCSIELQLLEVVVFCTDKVTMKAVQHPLCAGSDPNERWSVHCCFLRGFEEHHLPDDDVHALVEKAKRTQARRSEGYRASSSTIKQEEEGNDSRDNDDDNGDVDGDDVVHTATRSGRRKRSSTGQGPRKSTRVFLQS